MYFGDSEPEQSGVSAASSKLPILASVIVRTNRMQFQAPPPDEESALPRISGSGRYVQAHQDPLRVGEVADDPLEWGRQFPDQRGNSHDLVPPGKLRVLHQVDHLDLILPAHVLVTDPFQVRQRGD